MATNILELVLRAKNETQKVFTQVTKQATEVNNAISDMIKASDSNKRPRALMYIDIALTAINGTVTKTAKHLADLGRMKLNGITTAIRTLGRETKKALEEAEALTEEYQAVEDLGSSIGGAAAIPAAVGAAGAYAYAQFSLKVGELNTLLDGSLEKQKDLESQVLALSTAYGIDAVEVAQGYYNAVSSGATEAGKELEFMDVAARTAIAGATDLSAAVDGLSNIMNAFNVPSSEAVEVSEALFVAMKAGKTTVGELSRELSKSASLAATLSISYEEVLAAASAITTTGTPTSEAFTQISAAMSELLTNDKIIAVFNDLGYESASTAVKVLGLQGALDALATASDNNIDTLANMFGSQEALRVALTLTNTAADKFSEIMEDMEDRAGALDAAYKTVARTFGFELNKALTAGKGAFISLGDAISPVASTVLGFLESLFNGITDLNREFPTFTSVIASSVAILVTLGVVGGTAAMAIGFIGKGLTAVAAVLPAITGLMGGGFVAALTAAGSALLPIVALLGVIAGGTWFVGLVSEAMDAAQELDKLKESSDNALKSLQQYMQANPEVAKTNVRNMRISNELNAEQLASLKAQLEAKKEFNALGLKAIEYDAQTIKQAKDRYVQLEAEQKFIEQSLIAIQAMEKTRADKLATMTADQLNAEKDATKQRLDDLAKVSAEAIKANDPELIRAVNALYSDQRAILNTIVKALHEVKTAQGAQVRDIEILTDAYRSSAEAASDFRNNAAQALDIDFARAMDSLDTFQSGLDHAYDLGTMGGEEYIANTTRVLNNRLAVEEQHQRDLVALWAVEYNARKQHILATEKDDEEAAKELRKLERENEKFIVDSYKSRYASVKSLRDQSLADYRKHTAEVKRLEDAITNLAVDRESTVRDIRRTGLDDYAKYIDIQSELSDGLAKQQQAIAEGQYDLAEQYYSRNMSLAQQLNTEVELNGKTAISVEQGKLNAINGVTEAMKLQEDSLRRQKSEAEAAAEAEKQRYERLNTALETLNKVLIALATNSKLDIEFAVNDAETQARLKRIEAEAAKGAVVPLKTEVDSGDASKAAQEIGKTTNEIDRQYGDVTITTTAETGAFEQEIHRITDQTGYGAEVVVTMEDGQYYAQVSRLENDQIVATVAPQLVPDGMLTEFYATVRSQVEANPPKLPVGLDVSASSEEINEKLGSLVIEEMTTTVEVGADVSPAEKTINRYNEVINATKTNSLHDINVDNGAVEAAKAINSVDTSSTHTIYVREVEQRASGGSIGTGNFTRKRGFISGIGTSVSDSIPAMLSRGEFVTKASAVRKYGTGFMQLVNQGRLSKDLVDRLMSGVIPRFNTGGAVGLPTDKLASLGSMSETNVNFAFPDGQTVTMQGTEDSAKALVRALRGYTRT